MPGDDNLADTIYTMDTTSGTSAEARGLADHDDNTVNYELHLHSADYDVLDLRQRICDHIAPFLEGYIWQRDAFTLQSSSQVAPLWRQAKAHAADDAVIEDPLPPASQFLWGSTNYGDNVEDEWFITWLLLEISNHFPASARVWDGDGEFLLIEAAYSLPRYLKPVTSYNRVWLHAGSLHIIPPPGKGGGLEAWESPLSTITALAALQSSPAVTAAEGMRPYRTSLRRRIECYPHKAKQLMHRATAIIPLRLASVLRRDPQAVAGAVEAFYNRDPYDAQIAARMTHFPPENMVKILVHFNRCLYAQLALQEFTPAKRWPTTPAAGGVGSDLESTLLGAKLTAGFEILLAQGKRRADRFLKLVNEVSGEDSQVLLSEELVSDSDAWLREGTDEIEDELSLREAELMAGQNDTKPSQGEFNPRELTTRVKQFLMGLPADDIEKSEASQLNSNLEFQESRFLSELALALGLTGEGPGDASSDEGSSFYSQGDGAVDSEDHMVEQDPGRVVDKQYLLDQWEASTATDSDDEGHGFEEGTQIRVTGDQECDATSDDRAFMESYDSVLEEQLAGTTLGKSFARAEDGDVLTVHSGNESAVGAASIAAEDGSLRPIDVDLNLVSSLLASYEEQGGLPGPASNLAGLLGVKLELNALKD